MKKLKDNVFYAIDGAWGDRVIVIRNEGEWSALWDDGSYSCRFGLSDERVLKGHPVKVKV